MRRLGVCGTNFNNDGIILYEAMAVCLWPKLMEFT